MKITNVRVVNCNLESQVLVSYYPLCFLDLLINTTVFIISIGFDFDYTLVTYTDELLELIYEKALARLVTDRQYPTEMLQTGLKYDPCFSIRGLAVDKETGSWTIA